MMVRSLRVLALVLFAAVTAACGPGAPADEAAPAAPAKAAAPGRSNGPLSPEALVTQVQAWRDTHEADYTRDWVSIAGLHFLEPGTFTFGRAIENDIVVSANVPERLGALVVNEQGVRYEPAAGVTAIIKDQPVTGPVTLHDDSEPEPDEFIVDGVRMVIHRSGDRLSLRVRDPNGALARGFLGFTWFAIDPTWRVTGRFIPDETPTEKRVLNTVGDMDRFMTEGVIEFTLGGETLRVRPFTTRPNRFYVVFRDASAGEETYETARFLYADLNEDGTTTLDFNEAYNPPCSFNPYTTCPIPLPENILPLKILAGEKKYPIHPTIPSGE
jgi:hypothetical protein